MAMIEVLETPLPTSVDPAVAQMFATAAQYDATCVLQTTLDQYAIILTVIGMVLGVACTLLFQYTRRKAREKIEQAEYARQLKEAIDEQMNPKKP